MERKQFINTLGFGLFGACAGSCLLSCSKSGSDTGTSGGGAPTAPSAVNFTVNLSSEITRAGETVTRNGVIVARIDSGTTATAFTAVQIACTHQGTSINFDNTEGNFICPNHGSRFSTSGVVLNGPATANLKRYTVTIAGNTLTVTG